jgi:hypothetical protein
MKGLVLFVSSKASSEVIEGSIVLEDGSVATFHHNGKFMITEHYQGRVTSKTEDLWDELGEGKMYVQEWHDYQSFNSRMLNSMVIWLTGARDALMALEFQVVKSEEEESKIKKYLQT